MQRWSRLVIRCAIVGLAWCGWSSTAVWAETIGCTAITAAPFTITAAGHYCLTQDISANLATGNAIEIEASNVELDLNGHRLGNLLAGPGTTATGIHALDRKNITIKNGTVRGFLERIRLEDVGSGASQGHIVEDIRAELNTFTGIAVTGAGIIRNNLVVNSGGTTAFGPDAEIVGIFVDGAGSRVINNDVVNTVGVGTAAAEAIYVDSSSAVVEYNRVSNAGLPGGALDSFGILVSSLGTDVLVVDNRIAIMTKGVFYDGSTGKYGRNLTSGVTTPFTGGTASGGNND